MTYVYVNTSVPSIWNDIYDNTSVAVTSNGFAEVSHTGIKVSLIVFDSDLSNKSILIGASKVEMDLPNGTSIYHCKATLLLDGGNNLLFSTSQNCDFFVT